MRVFGKVLTFASAFENKRKLSCSGHTRKSSLNRLHTQSSSTRSCLSWRVIRGAWWRQGKDEPKIQSRCFKLQDGASCDRQNKPLALAGENLRSEYFERNIKIFITYIIIVQSAVLFRFLLSKIFLIGMIFINYWLFQMIVTIYLKLLTISFFYDIVVVIW